MTDEVGLDFEYVGVDELLDSVNSVHSVVVVSMISVVVVTCPGGEEPELR